MHHPHFIRYAATALALSQAVIGSCYANTVNMYVSSRAGGVVRVIDTNTEQVVNTVPGFTNPSQIAWDGGTGMYVIEDSVPGRVAIMDITNNHISEVSGDFNEPFGIAFDGRTGMYVCNTGDSTVSIIDTEASAVTTVVSLPNGELSGLAFDGGTGMYLIDRFNPVVYVINTDLLNIISSISLPFNPFGIAWDGATGMYVHPLSGQDLGVINTQTQLLSNVITLEYEVDNIGWDGRTGMYISSVSDVNIINTRTLEPAWLTINLNEILVGFGSDGGTGMYAITSSHNAFVIDTNTFQVVNTIGVGNHPVAIVRAVIGTTTLLVVELSNIAEAALELPGGEAVSLVGKPIPDISGSDTLKILVSSEGSVIATVTVNLLANTAFSDNPAVLASLVQNNNASVASLKIEMIQSQ